MSFRISDPRRRLVMRPARRTNLVFNLAEVLWYLSGRDDVEYLAYYASRVRQYSSDGIRLTGTAYGPRIFHYGPSLVNQWRRVVRSIGADADTKRAAILVFHPDELADVDNPDVACTLALQFLLRESALHCVAFMRANDVYRGMVSDVFSFTFLQEVMACELGVDVGSYTHSVGSLHLYESDLAAAERLVRSQPADTHACDRMPAIPRGDNWSHIALIMRQEEQLRLNRKSLEVAELDEMSLPDYWRWVLVMFELYRQVKYGISQSAPHMLRALPSMYSSTLVNRFPELVPNGFGTRSQSKPFSPPKHPFA